VAIQELFELDVDAYKKGDDNSNADDGEEDS
jgi:hypothetical protein